jgi:hypothetical protein
MSRGPRKSKEVREAEARELELYAMKRSEFHPRLCCRGCGGFGVATKWLPGVGPVCPECFDHVDFDGRATPAEPGTTAVGATPQLALFEN